MLPKFKRKFWPNNWTDGQTDTKEHNFNTFRNNILKNKVERITVYEE